MILDIMLPGINGFEVLKRLESRKSGGIIMLTAKEDIVDKVLGLELGADDYITKPFDMRELLARLRSLLRRLQVKAGNQAQTEIQLDGLMHHHRGNRGDRSYLVSRPVNARLPTQNCNQWCRQ